MDFFKFLVVSLAKDLYIVWSTIPDANENEQDDEDLIQGLVVEKERNWYQADNDIDHLASGKKKSCFLAHGIQGFTLL